MPGAPSSPRTASGDAASSSAKTSAPTPDGDMEGPQVDPAEPFRFLWSISVFAFKKTEGWFADDLLGNALPLAFELAGRDDAANAIRETLTRGHPKRARLIGATGAVAIALVALLAIASAAFVKSLLAAVVAAAAGAVNLASGLVYHTLWRPRWYATMTSVIGIQWQRRVPLASMFWPILVLLWFAGGGWWGVFATASACGAVAVSGLSFWISGAGALTFELVIRTSWITRWWVRAIFASLALAGWAFACLLALAGRAARSAAGEGLASDPNSPILPALAYADCDGEIARVLRCREYFSVLEVLATADDAEIKRSYRKKVIVVHPDKNPGKAHCEEAFDRVKTAFEKLGNAENRKDYMRSLALAYEEGRYEQSEGHARAHAAPQPGHACPRRAEPAPRSHGPRGRKGKKRKG